MSSTAASLSPATTCSPPGSASFPGWALRCRYGAACAQTGRLTPPSSRRGFSRRRSSSFSTPHSCRITSCRGIRRSSCCWRWPGGSAHPGLPPDCPALQNGCRLPWLPSSSPAGHLSQQCRLPMPLSIPCLAARCWCSPACWRLAGWWWLSCGNKVSLSETRHLSASRCCSPAQASRIWAAACAPLPSRCRWRHRRARSRQT